MITEKVNRKVEALWEDQFPDSADVWMPLVYPPLQEDSILFIGLNPSFSERGFRTILGDTPYANTLPREFFHWRNRSKFDMATAIAIESIAKKKYRFFGKFRELSEYVEVPWEHIDLFFYRQTSQNRFKPIVFKDDHRLNKFGSEQLELSKTLIEAVKPQIIVVANALAARIFQKEYNPKFDEEIGCHVVALNKKSVPVFLASMLTGQRAMDNYSYQRLKWHIRHVYEQRSKAK